MHRRTFAEACLASLSVVPFFSKKPAEPAVPKELAPGKGRSLCLQADWFPRLPDAVAGMNNHLPDNTTLYCTRLENGRAMVWLDVYKPIRSANAPQG